MTQQQWAEEQANRIAQAVKSLRGKRSGQWLSDRTAEAGHRISRSTIADLESGRRKYVSTAELSVLAWALNVPPVSLLYPALPDGEVEVVPGERVKSIEAATWFSGELTFEPEILSQEELADDEEWRRRAELHAALYRGKALIVLSRERLMLRSQIESLTRTVQRMRDGGAAEFADTLTPDIAVAQQRLDKIEEELRLSPGAVVSNGG